MKKARINETVFILMVICFLGGCAGRSEQKNTMKTKSQRYKGLPVELYLPSDEGIPVRVEAKEEIPVKLQLQEDNVKPVKVAIQSNEGLPLKLNIEGDKALPVKLDMEGDKGLPVEMKITRKTLILSLIPVGVSLIAAIGACIAGIGAWRSARNTRLAAEGQLFFTQMHKYGSEEMRDALRTLSSWPNKEEGKDLAEKAAHWKKKLDSGDSYADEVDLARRRITFYFLTTLRLNKSKYSRKHFLKEACHVDGIKIMCDIAEHLAKALDPKYNKAFFNKLKKLREEFLDS